jgi:hypothetical protein
MTNRCGGPQCAFPLSSQRVLKLVGPDKRDEWCRRWGCLNRQGERDMRCSGTLGVAVVAAPEWLDG